jgi:hypothetical protein
MHRCRLKDPARCRCLGGSLSTRIAMKIRERDYNIHVPINAIVGNQIFRTFVFCGGKVITATRIGLRRPYEDNSRWSEGLCFLQSEARRP